jgi:2-oxoglutarate ferredoxin oxidoreductase subunit alpha
MSDAKGRTLLLQGNESCAMGAIYAGCRFFGGYPITPSTEIAEHLARKLPTVNGAFIQMEDEIASISSIIGSSLAGVKAMTATSGPGFSLMQENLGLAAVLEAPIVIVNIMRSGASTGHPTGTGQGDLMQSRWGTHSDHPVVALAPATSQEMFDLTVKAFNIAEKLRVPVVLLPEAVVGHIREAVYIPADGEMEVIDRDRPDSYEDFRFFERNKSGVAHPPDLGTGFRPHYTGLTHDETGFFTGVPEKVNAFTVGLNSKIEVNREFLTDYCEEAVEDADVVLVSFGVTSRACAHVTRDLRKHGIRAGCFRPRIVWPFPDERLRQIAQNAHTFIVPELNLGMMRGEVERIVGPDKRVVGINRVDGTMLTLERIQEEVKEVLA